MRQHLLLFLLPMAATAAQQCPVDKLVSYTWGNENSDSLIHVEADDASMSAEAIDFSGNVIATRDQESFYGENINYQRNKKNIRSDETITYGNPHFALRASSAEYSFKQQSGRFGKTEYYLAKQNAVGQASSIQVFRKKELEHLTDATYTTCARLNSNWFLKAKKITLNHKEDIGIAKDVTFRIADVPVMYLPYFSFPLSDKRKTGFLPPRLSTNSSRGAELTIPFYINIAPNQDLTLYPRLMAKRGALIGSEYRYLYEKFNGYVSGEYLYRDIKRDEKRWSLKTYHSYQPTPDINISALYQRVSDKDYLEDLSNSIKLTHDKFLPSYLKADYRWSPNYNISAEVRRYQVADKNYDESDKPYSLLPRISGRGQWSIGDYFNFSSDTQLTNFDKEGFVSGWRFNQNLAFSYLFQNSYSFVKPKIQYRFSSYALKNQLSGNPSNVTLGIPTFSIDSGLYFNRETSWFGRSATQTLEPRLYYLYTPYYNQSNIPDFDTALVDSSYDAMFLDNRFNGGDRVGDANQLTTAVSTTFIDNSNGKELAKFSVGQIQYFKNRHVSLTDSIANNSRSNIIAEGRANIYNNIDLRGLIHRNIDTNKTEKSLFGIMYSPDINKSVSFSHLYDRNNYRQFDLAGMWQINDQWRGFWHWNYSLEYKKTIDTLAGFEYSDCCWSVSFGARQKRTSAASNDKPETSIYLEFVLNGLGSIGNGTHNILKSAIPNYRPLSYERNN
ncbi:MAG: LPS-assembly protein LptD [Gammaproteobacteria bacterium]|nr:LPS-assembly protein LptD [Gammaproteobacteria bacterium]